MSLELIKKEYLIEKRNVLNEMRTNNMTLQGSRFFSIYLSKINSRDQKTRLVRFSLKEFSSIMGFTGNFNFSHYESIKNRLLGFIVDRITPSGRGIESFQLFKRCVLEQSQNGEWYFEIDAHDDALPLMFEFKDHYFTYQLWNALRLSSFNQLRIYEILKQHEYKGNVSITLVDLRHMLNITAEEYQRWDSFKRDVLEKCKNALKEKTDIKYTYDPIRNGRGGKVTGIKFFIEKNEDYVDQLCLFEYIDQTEATEITLTRDETPIKKDKQPPKSPSEKKKELDEAKKSDFWWYAKEIANKKVEQNNSIKNTPERYAIGIIKNWNEAGYKTIQDLRESGEISRDMQEPSFNLDKL